MHLTIQPSPTRWRARLASDVRVHMEAIGAFLIISGLLFIVFPGLKHARSIARFTDCLKTEHHDIWVKLGKPELSVLYPFRSLPALRLLDKKVADFDSVPKLKQLQSRARFWFYAFGANFGVILIGCFLVVASNAL